MEKQIKICSVSGFTSMLGGKWKLIIIDRLRKREVLRFGFLAASIDVNPDTEHILNCFSISYIRITTLK